MNTYTLLLQINKKLDMLLKMITQDSDNGLIESGVGKAMYGQENKELFKKYEVNHG